MPNVIDIIQSVQVPQLIKDELIKNGKPVLDDKNRPVHYTGGFAIVFPFNVNGQGWAFRCWSADIGNVEKRLHTLSAELKVLNLPYFCDFAYETAGIIINGTTYPTTRMQWIDGKNIKDYLCEYKISPSVIRNLANDFIEMCRELHQHKIAHGDLQHGNILVSNKKLYLIDYDSVYLSALKGEADIIAGLPDYQHPKRKDNKIASEKLDYFSELIIYLSIRAIAEDSSLVDKYQVDDADRLLFSKEDFVDLKNSQIYKDIHALGKEYQDMLDVLEEYLSFNSIDELLPFEAVLQKNKVSFCSSVYKAVRNKQKIIIEWDVPFDAEVSIKETQKDDAQKCGNKGHFSTTLYESTTFELLIKTQEGYEITKTVSVDVFDECEIEFTSDKNFVFPTIPVKLKWNVKNAKRIWLDNEEVEASGTKVIEPSKFTVCIISAEDEFGIKEKRIEIGMLPIPLVKTIMVPTPEIVNNMSITVQQPKYIVGVQFPNIEIKKINTVIPKVPSFKDMGLDIELKMPIPRFSLKSAIKKVFNRKKRKSNGTE